MRVIKLLLFSTLVFAQSDPLVQGLESFHKGDFLQAERSFRASLKGAIGNDAERAQAFLALTLAATNRCTEAESALVKAGVSTNSDIQRLAGLALVQCRIAGNRLDDAARRDMA